MTIDQLIEELKEAKRVVGGNQHVLIEIEDGEKKIVTVTTRLGKCYIDAGITADYFAIEYH